MDYQNLYENLLKAYEPYDDIIKAVYKQLGCEDEEEFFRIASDVMTPCGCGANAGFTGFIYYSDTVEFYLQNRDGVRRLLNKAVDDGIGYNSAVEMVSKFNSCGDLYSMDEIGMALYDPQEHDDLTTLYDTLAKYALEEVAYWANDFEYDNRQD